MILGYERSLKSTEFYKMDKNAQELLDNRLKNARMGWGKSLSRFDWSLTCTAPILCHKWMKRL